MHTLNDKTATADLGIETQSERTRIEDALYFVAQCGWKTNGENFLVALARYLGETVGVAYVVIDKLADEPGIAETVALYASGAIVPNMTYSLKGTPCENVFNGCLCCHRQGVQQLFPEDTLLVDMGVESYIGIPLWGSDGRAIGLIALMDNAPIIDQTLISHLLQLVAIRAAAELERERNIKELTLLLELGERLVSELDMENVLALVAETARQVVHAETMVLPMIDPDEQTFTYRGASGEYANMILHQTFPIHEGSCGWVIQNQRPLLFGDGGGFDLDAGACWQPGMASQLLVPLICRGVIIGGLSAMGKQGGGAFNQRDLTVLTLFANQAGIAIDNARLFQKLGVEEARLRQANATLEQRVEERTWAIARVNEELAARERKFRTLAENSPDNILHFDAGCRCLYANPRMVKTLGIPADAMLGKTPMDFYPSGEQREYQDMLEEALRTGADVKLDAVFPVSGEVVRCYQEMLEEVLRSGADGELDAVLQAPGEGVRYHNIRFVAERDHDGTVTGVLVIGCDITERKQAEEALKESKRTLEALSITDALTGIANRRRFDEALSQEYARHARSGAELSLILLDIDHFKAFNDTYGHVAGDDCLRRIGRVIADCASRPADLAARYGGEEFVCILPETDRTGAVIIAERIRRGIQTLAIPHRGSDTSDCVTASLGVVTLRCKTEGAAIDIISQADELLYRAKSRGRNRVECAAPQDYELTDAGAIYQPSSLVEAQQ